MQPDLEAAGRFLAALTLDQKHTFQTFDDTKRGRPGLTRIVHGSFTSRAAELSRLNDKGAGVFVLVNRGDGAGRKAINVTGARALFVDLDGAPITPVLAGPIAPRIVVETSLGKWHAYWPIADLPIERFSAAQKALALRFGGDPRVHDCSRVLRLPGFIHLKAAPFQSRLIACEQAPLTWREMSEAFGLEQRFTLPDQIEQGDRNTKLYKLARSAATKGIPQAEQLERALSVNAQRCTPPLASSEVSRIVASAYAAPVDGAAAIPLAVMDSAEYKRLSDGARTLLLVAYRRLDGFNADGISLAHSECAPWFPNDKRFYRLRKEVLQSGLLLATRAPCKPKPGGRPTAGLYRLAIGAKPSPYRRGALGTKPSPPEAFQAGAVAALDPALGVTAPKGGGK